LGAEAMTIFADTCAAKTLGGHCHRGGARLPFCDLHPGVIPRFLTIIGGLTVAALALAISGLIVSVLRTKPAAAPAIVPQVKPISN